MQLLPTTLATLICLSVPGSAVAAEQSVTLLGTIMKWRYPDAKIGEAQIADAATIDADGQRTVPSSVLKTTMTTADSVNDVLSFYRQLLKRTPTNDARQGIEPHEGRSVIFSNESTSRPFAFHTIMVNDTDRTTLLIITRGIGEDQTHITWKQYLKHQVGG